MRGVEGQQKGTEWILNDLLQVKQNKGRADEFWKVSFATSEESFHLNPGKWRVTDVSLTQMDFSFLLCHFPPRS